MQEHWKCDVAAPGRLYLIIGEAGSVHVKENICCDAS